MTAKPKRVVDIDEAMNRAAQAAILRHRQANVPLVVWKNGRTTLLDPHTLEELLDQSPVQGPSNSSTADG